MGVGVKLRGSDRIDLKRMEKANSDHLELLRKIS